MPVASPAAGQPPNNPASLAAPAPEPRAIRPLTRIVARFRPEWTSCSTRPRRASTWNRYAICCRSGDTRHRAERPRHYFLGRHRGPDPRHRSPPAGSTPGSDPGRSMALGVGVRIVVYPEALDQLAARRGALRATPRPPRSRPRRGTPRAHQPSDGEVGGPSVPHSRSYQLPVRERDGPSTSVGSCRTRRRITPRAHRGDRRHASGLHPRPQLDDGPDTTSLTCAGHDMDITSARMTRHGRAPPLSAGSTSARCPESPTTAPC